MKKFALYIMMALFVLQSTGYSYIVASFYINRDYIADNICINRFDAIPVCRGTCYLTDQLKKESKKEQKVPNLKEKEVHLFVNEPLIYHISGTYAHYIPRSVYHYKKQLVNSRFLYSVFHPPEVA